MNPFGLARFVSVSQTEQAVAVSCSLPQDENRSQPAHPGQLEAEIRDSRLLAAALGALGKAGSDRCYLTTWCFQQPPCCKAALQGRLRVALDNFSQVHVTHMRQLLERCLVSRASHGSNLRFEGWFFLSPGGLHFDDARASSGARPWRCCRGGRRLRARNLELGRANFKGREVLRI